MPFFKLQMRKIITVWSFFMKNIFAYLALIFGVFAVSTSAIFVRLADAPAAITAFYRLFLTTLMLLPVVLLGRSQRHELQQLSLKKLGLSAAAGVLLGIHYILWFGSLSYTSVASSTVLVTLQPLFSIVFGYFLLKEHQPKLGLIGCAIALVGSFIIGYGDFQLHPGAFMGDVMAILSAAVVSLYLFIGQIVRKNTSATVYSVLAFGCSALFLALCSLILHQPFAGYTAQTWASFFGLAIVATIMGQFIFNLLLKWVSATSISMGILGEPIGASILAWFILSEGITLRQGIGMCIILCGLTLYFLAAPIEKRIRARR